MSLDRTVAPSIGEPPALRLPPIRHYRLSNGLRILLVERRELPVVDLQLVIGTGAAADPPRLAGRAALAADLLDEGTETRGALEIAAAVDQLGADLRISASWDAAYLSLHVLAPRLAPALDVLADVLLHPAFEPAEIERKKLERQAALLQERQEPRMMAAKAFAATLYGPEHPYGAPLHGTAASLERIGREEIVAFYADFCRPNNAFLVAVGDLDAAALLPRLEAALGGWAPADVPPLPSLAGPPPRSPAIVGVHKPGAAQTEIRVGRIGVERATADFFPLLVLNTILGCAFTSRLNQKLRQEKGYTYGAWSRFDMRAAPGPFIAGSAVFTDATADATADVLAELRRIGEEAVPEGELERARSYIARGFPRQFETTASIAAHVAELGLYHLPDDYFDQYVEHVRAVTADDVRRVARTYLTADDLAVVVAGDLEQVREGLERLGLGPLTAREVE